MEKPYELKLASGKVVKWTGTDGVNAAERYVDCVRDAEVVAWREAETTNIIVTAPDLRRFID